MNKKAYSIVINLVFIGILLWFIFSKFMPIIAPLFNNDKNTVGYENFEVLNWKIQRLLNDETIEKSDTMFFEMEKGFSLIAFDSGELIAHICEEEDIERPEQCPDIEKGCLCLYNEKAQKCSIFDEETVFKSFFVDDDFDEGFKGCGVDMERTHEDGLKYKYGKLLFSHKTKFSHDLYIEVKEKSGSVEILIGKADEKTKQSRYKFVSMCPDTLVGDCKGKHFDEVDDGFRCRFDEGENFCVKEEINDCDDRHWMKGEYCNCGETAYNKGFCINGAFELLEKNCENVDTCDSNQNPWNCEFDVCRTKEKYNCYFKEEGFVRGLVTDDCKSCNEFSLCENYGSNQAFCEQDICGVTKRRIQAPGHECVFSSGSCEDYFSSNLNFDTPVNAQECYEKNRPSVYDYSNNECKDCSSYASYTTRCKSNSFNANSRCDFYNEMNPSDNAQRKADPCDCDGDEKFPDDVCA